VLRLGVVASTELAGYGVLASGFDVAKLPAVAALGRGERLVGPFNHTIGAI